MSKDDATTRSASDRPALADVDESGRTQQQYSGTAADRLVVEAL